MKTQTMTTIDVVAMKHLTYFFAFIIGSVGLSPESFMILAVLMMIDTFTGVVRTIRIRGGQSFTSMRLTSGIIRKSLIIIVPLVIAWAGKGAGIDLSTLAQGVLAVLVLSEAYSILGNIHAIHIGKDVREFDAIAWILGLVRSELENKLKSAGGNKTDDGHKDV